MKASSAIGSGGMSFGRDGDAARFDWSYLFAVEFGNNGGDWRLVFEDQNDPSFLVAMHGKERRLGVFVHRSGFGEITVPGRMSPQVIYPKFSMKLAKDKEKFHAMAKDAAMKLLTFIKEKKL